MRLRYFSLSEFQCKCQSRHGVICLRYPSTDTKWLGIDENLLKLLDDLREKVGSPIHVLSGYRCPAHNKAVGGRPHSFHLLGMAADIVCRALSPERLHAILEEEFKPGGLGLYDSFVHVDTRSTGPARWDRRSK